MNDRDHRTREIAYFIWEEEGRPEGQADRHWLTAQSIVEPAVQALPETAKKADDLEAIKKAVDDAAAVGGGLWLPYLGFLFYLAIAAGAVTHADLFEKPVKI